MSKCSVFIATSLDGFIAREDGGIDWLSSPDMESEEGEDYGYHSFIKTVDAMVMGRNTFELVLTFGEWPYGKMPLFVLTNQGVKIPEKISETVSQMAGEPQEIVQQLEEKGYHHFYIDGGKTIQGFLHAGLIDEMTITTIPVLIGSGIPLFGPVSNDIKLALLQSRSYKNGIVQNQYQIKKQN